MNPVNLHSRGQPYCVIGEHRSPARKIPFFQVSCSFWEVIWLQRYRFQTQTVDSIGQFSFIALITSSLWLVSYDWRNATTGQLAKFTALFQSYSRSKLRSQSFDFSFRIESAVETIGLSVPLADLEKRVKQSRKYFILCCKCENCAKTILLYQPSTAVYACPRRIEN